MSQSTYNESIHKQFVDALRECLGLEPLYRASDSSSFYLQEHSPQGLLLGSASNASGRVPMRSAASR